MPFNWMPPISRARYQVLQPPYKRFLGLIVTKRCLCSLASGNYSLIKRDLLGGMTRRRWQSATNGPSGPCAFSTIPPPPFVPPRLIDKPIDEETLPSYRVEDFYPTGPGHLLHGVYRVITKIGYGAGSTVWLAEDVRWTKSTCERPRYVVIKIATNGPRSAHAATRELEIGHLAASKRTTHPGTPFIRAPIDSFQIDGPHGQHPCLVYVPLRETLFRFQGKLGGRRLPRPLVKLYVAYLLQALDFLHTECHLIHTDLKDDNILMTLENEHVLEQFVQSQRSTPLPRHVRDDGVTVFLSQGDLGPFQGYTMKPRLADFDLAFPGMPDGQLHIHPAVQPARYRAPEVILGTGWSYSADIWNLGLLMWNLLEDVNIFNGLFDANGHYDARTHLAQMISLLGPPPKELLQRERQYRELDFEDAVLNPQGRMVKTVCEYWGGPFFDDVGVFLFNDLVQQDRKLEDTVTELEGVEKDRFLDFARSMLQWLPEKRRTAAELLEHPFILSLEDEE